MITQYGIKYHVDLSGAIRQISRDMIFEPTATTPFVKLSEDEKLLTVKGNSSMQDIHLFYDPVISRTKEYLEAKGQLSVHLMFKTLNTSSVKVLFDLFKYFRSQTKAGAKIRVVWAAESDHPEMLETGLDFSEIYELNFTFLTI